MVMLSNIKLVSGETTQVTALLTHQSKQNILNGIDEAVQDYLQLSPNPVSDFIFVNGLNFTTEKVNYEFYDISGKLVTSGFLNKKSTINLKYFDAGVYVAKFYADNEILSINRIVKK